MNPSTELARAVVTALRGAGVREVVLAPGSRNAPLSFALYDVAQAGGLRLHTRIDERTGAFLALGMAKVSGRAVAVCCTSGTAVANLLPAVVEAAHAGVPLVVVTADRPARLRGTGSNQTTDQVGIFGPFAPTFDVDAADPDELLAFVRTHEFTRPVHLNVQLDDPLLPDDAWDGGEVLAWAVTLAVSRWPETVRSTSGRAPSSWPATTQARRRGCSRRRRAGRCSPSRPAAAAPGTTPSGPTACCSGATWVNGSSGSWFSGTRPSPGRCNGSWPATTSRWSRSAPSGRWTNRPFAVDAATSPVAFEARRSCLARRVAYGGPRAVASRRRLRRSPARPHAVRRRGRSRRREPTARPARRGSEQPDPRPRPDGRRAPRRGAALRARQSRTGRHRRHRVDRDRCCSRAAEELSRHRLRRRCDLPPRRDGVVPGTRRGAARPDDRGGQRRWRLDLRHARAGCAEHAEHYEQLFGTPHHVDLASLCAATRTPHWQVTSRAELEHALASPNGGIEVVEAVIRRDNRADLDRRNPRAGPVGGPTRGSRGSAGAGQATGVSQTRTQSTYMCCGSFLSGRASSAS